MRRTSLVALRRGSLRRGSVRRASLVPASTSLDLPWDILDRLLIPILCCHAAAIILSGVLNLLHISDVSTLTLFAWFALSTGGAILFYHHLKVWYVFHFLQFFSLSLYLHYITLYFAFRLALNTASNECSCCFFHMIILVIKVFLTSCRVFSFNRIFIICSNSSNDDSATNRIIEMFILCCSCHILFQIYFLTHISYRSISSYWLSDSQSTMKFSPKVKKNEIGYKWVGEISLFLNYGNPYTHFICNTLTSMGNKEINKKKQRPNCLMQGYICLRRKTRRSNIELKWF